MSDPNFGFGKFVPGFDFLQSLAKGASQNLPQMPSMANWVAPTLNVEELEKRITELKAVHFWLDQNGKALTATIQALELQKMTLATLKGMNVKMGDVANAMKLRTADAMMMGGVKEVDGEADAAPPEAASKPPARKKAASGKAAAIPVGGAGMVDPMQWWGALTQQFQEIAGAAMKDAAQRTAVDTARNMATGVAKEAMKAASGMAKAATAGRARTAPAKKTRARKKAS